MPAHKLISNLASPRLTTCLVAAATRTRRGDGGKNSTLYVAKPSCPAAQALKFSARYFSGRTDARGNGVPFRKIVSIES
jgi:hypothetical protein